MANNSSSFRATQWDPVLILVRSPPYWTGLDWTELDDKTTAKLCFFTYSLFSSPHTHTIHMLNQSQIVCLQAVWYISISTIVFTLFRFSGTDITLDAILNYREIRVDNAQGVLLGIAWLLNSVVG